MVNPTGSSPLFQPKSQDSSFLSPAQEATVSDIVQLLPMNPAAAVIQIQNLLASSPPLPTAYKEELDAAINAVSIAQDIGSGTFWLMGINFAAGLVQNYPISDTAPSIPTSTLNALGSALSSSPPNWQGLVLTLYGMNTSSLPTGYAGLVQLALNQAQAAELAKNDPTTAQGQGAQYFNLILQMLA